MTNDQSDDPGFTRRQALALSGVAVLGGALGAHEAAAAESIGTWPAGTEGDSVFIGLTPPLTGPYSVPGQDLRKGYELAIDHINSGDALMKKIAPKVSGGLLGKKIAFGVSDSESKPNVAVQAWSGFVSNKKAVLLSGSCSSAVAVAGNKFAQRSKVIYLCGVSGSNDTTGKDCTRYSFRTCFYGQTAAAALAPVLLKELGQNKKVAYMTPDYTYGHTVQKSMEEYLKKGGWTTVSNQVSPLGTSDFSSYVLNVANSGADVVVNINWGNDAVASTKQLNQFGVLKRAKLVIAYSVPFIAKEVGADLTQGVFTSTDWWWTVADKFPLSKMFLESFRKKWGYTPDWSGEAGYMQIACWARMVSEAGTFNPVEIIKQYEKGEHFDSLVGEVWFRPQDHQLVRPVFVMRGKAPKEMKSPDDYWDVIEVAPGEPLMQAPDAFGCKLGEYT